MIPSPEVGGGLSLYGLCGIPISVLLYAVLFRADIKALGEAPTLLPIGLGLTGGLAFAAAAKPVGNGALGVALSASLFD